MNRNTLLLLVISLVAFGVMMRLSPHAPNLTPLTAIIFVSSLYLSKRWAIFIPGSILLMSDFVLGWYDWKIMASVYLSFVLIACLSFLAKKDKTVVSIFAPVISSSLLFFLITNGAVWLFSPWYEKSFVGLMYAYEMGLPFLRNMMTGDILYTVALILIFELALSLAKSHRNLSTKSNQPSIATT